MMKTLTLIVFTLGIPTTILAMIFLGFLLWWLLNKLTEPVLEPPVGL